MKKIIWAIIACQLFFSGISIAGAEDNSVQSEYFQAEIKSMISEKELASGGTEYEFKAEVLTGDMEGEEIIITSTQTGAYSSNDYKAGEKVLIASYTSMEGENVFYISDYVRDTDIYILSAVRMSAVTVKQRFTMPRPIPTGRPGHGARPRILYISPFRERGRRLPTGTFIYWVDKAVARTFPHYIKQLLIHQEISERFLRRLKVSYPWR